MLSRKAVDTLQQARAAGVAASDAIADAYCGPERAALGRTYLRENIKYALGEREMAGLVKYYELAQKHGVVDGFSRPAFY